MAGSVKSCLCVAVLLALPFVCSSCGDDMWREPKGVHPRVPPTDRTSRAGLIATFARAHEDRHIELFAECLHTDYVFLMCESTWDIWDFPEWLSKAQDVEITSNMFTLDAVSAVTADFTNLTQASTNPEDNFIPVVVGSPPDTMTLLWAECAVDMHVVEETPTETVDHWVDGRAQFYLRPDPTLEGHWVIWKIKDLGDAGRKDGVSTDKSTWSVLKLMFR